MPEIIVTKPFKFAHGGHRVEEFEPGKKPVETTEEVAQLALAEGWARKAHRAAPRNKDAAGQRDTKGDEAGTGNESADQARA
jgi:hypothetical protein